MSGKEIGTHLTEFFTAILMRRLYVMIAFVSYIKSFPISGAALAAN